MSTHWWSRKAHPGVVARVHLHCDGRDVLQEELVPLLLKVDLIHVDVDGGHVLVAALDPFVLSGKEERRDSGDLSGSRWGVLKLSDG